MDTSHGGGVTTGGILYAHGIGMHEIVCSASSHDVFAVKDSRRARVLVLSWVVVRAKGGLFVPVLSLKQ